jgi:hypothetical protein
VSPALALAYLRDGGGTMVNMVTSRNGSVAVASEGARRAAAAAAHGARPDAAEAVRQEAQLSKLRQALDKITTSPGGWAEEGAQQEWHDRRVTLRLDPSRFIDCLGQVQQSLR